MMEAGQYYEGTVNQVMGDGIMRYKALAEKHGSLEDLAWFPSYGVLYRVKALIAQQQGAPDQASQHFEQSLQLMSAHGYKPDPARKH
jgi:hypothetical protein